MKPVIFDPMAKAEYREAVDHYESKRRGLGLEFQAAMERAIAEIRQQPQRYPVYDEEDVRQFIIKRFPYSLIYSELGDSIWIAAVAHHHRRPGYWKGRKPV